MRDNVKKWYIENYPSDPLGADIPAALTFRDFFDALDHYRDIYDLLGDAADSIVRERIFARLADIMDCDYGYIYDQWLAAARVKKI